VPREVDDCTPRGAPGEQERALPGATPPPPFLLAAGGSVRLAPPACPSPAPRATLTQGASSQSRGRTWAGDRATLPGRVALEGWATPFQAQLHFALSRTTGWAAQRASVLISPNSWLSVDPREHHAPGSAPKVILQCISHGYRPCNPLFGYLRRSYVRKGTRTTFRVRVPPQDAQEGAQIMLPPRRGGGGWRESDGVTW